MGGMTSNSDDRRAHFTCVWAIENASSLILFQDILSSPIFTVKSMQNTKWNLSLQPPLSFYEGMFIYLFREKEDNGPDNIEIDYELSFLGKDGLPLIKRTFEYGFLRGRHGGLQYLAKKVDVLSLRREELLPTDVLTIRCRMWKKGTETPKPDVCFARTRMRMDRHCIVWAIKDFSILPPEHKITRQLKSTSENVPSLTLTFCFRRCNGNKIYISIDIDRSDVTKRSHVMGKISLLDAEGAVVHSMDVKCCAYASINFFEKRNLLSDKATLLPNDVLSMRFEFEVLHGSSWSGIENSAESESVVNTEVSGKHIKSVADDCHFRQNVRRYFEDGIFSDVTLRADAETFLVHKIILSSRSSVFKAMFTNDMKEKTSECINVPDVDPGTLRCLLRYIYTNEFPEEEWDKAADLFRAADKYALMELRQLCSAILKLDISRTNVCCVLFLADMYNDKELHKAVLDFISHNLDVFNSTEWNVFKNKYSELAMETMERIAYKVSDSKQTI